MNVILKENYGMLVAKATGKPISAEVSLPSDIAELSVKEKDRDSIVFGIIHDFRFRSQLSRGYTEFFLQVLEYRPVRLFWKFSTEEEVVWVSLEKKVEPLLRVPRYRKFPCY